MKHNNEQHDKHGSSRDHHKMMLEDFRKRFYISLALTVPVLLLSPLIQDIFNYKLIFTGDIYVLYFISSIIFFYGGWPFLAGLVNELKNKRPGMMTLIGIAISVAYIYSAFVVFGLEGKFFFWELATLIDIMLLGHWLEMKSVLGASRALEELVKLMPQTAHLLRNGKIEDVKMSELKKDDIVLIKAGEKVPADGTIVKGESYFNQSMLTGESKPVKRKINDELFGGSVNGDSVIEMKIRTTGKDSYLEKVIGLVKDAQASKSKTQNLADKAAMWLTIIGISVGIITFLVWYFTTYDVPFSLERMATVMVITCPHALGLAIPLVVAVSTSLAAKNGLLIRNRTAFENSRKISTIVFDKTGTLTEGKFSVSSIKSYNSQLKEIDIIELAASLEQKSEHPIAKGIIYEAQKRKAETKKIANFKVLTGAGISGIINASEYKIISPNYLSKYKINVPENENNIAETKVYILKNNKLIGSIGLSDKIRSESFKAIEILQKQNIKCIMMTGDNKEAAKYVSEKLKLDDFFAEVLPHQKQDKIKKLQEKGQFVAMTGDGINDAPALAQADIGIAVGSGTDVAAETADIILVESNPIDITNLILFGKATYSKMIENLFWATGYNIIAIPLAAGVLYNQGIVISPALGAALMSISTIIVAINARTLSVRQK